MPIQHFTVGESYPALDSLAYPTYIVALLSTALNLSLTPAQLLGGIINRDCNAADRSDTLPTAAALIAAMPGAAIGTSFEFLIRNVSGAGNTSTLQTNTGVTLSGTMAVLQGYTARFLVNVTNATPGLEAITVFSLGNLLH